MLPPSPGGKGQALWSRQPVLSPASFLTSRGLRSFMSEMGVMAPPPRPVVLRVTRGGRHQGLEQRVTGKHSVHVRCFKFFLAFEGSQSTSKALRIPALKK